MGTDAMIAESSGVDTSVLRYRVGLEACLASCERLEGRSEVVRQASMSYSLRASGGRSGRPDQMTESGSRGGIKRVRVDVEMW